MKKKPPLLIRQLGLKEYQPTWHAMRDFTIQRTPNTLSELWIVEHPPVFTQGQAGKAEHILDTGNIPIVKTDRGGQVTYHGPGQLVIYLLISLHEVDLGVRALVNTMENTIIQLLAEHGVTATAKPEAPGVYVDGAKIASLGLRVKRGCTYHGLALNIDMDLNPFNHINPCGYKGLAITQTKNQGIEASIDSLTQETVKILTSRLGYEVVGFAKDV